jgi:protein-disulfide isomerase
VLESRGAIFVAVLITILVALAIVFPQTQENSHAGVTERPAAHRVVGAAELTEQQKNDIRNIVREYLTENPVVIPEAQEVFQSDQQQPQRSNQKATSSALAANMDRLVNTRHEPYIGNPNATVSVVEFFDYQCSYCKRMAEDLAKLVEEDPDLLIVFKELPVLGKESNLAARAALAATKQGKYQEFHLAFMRLRGGLSERAVFGLANRLGLDEERLRRDMNSQDIESSIQENYRLAQEIGVRGTPAFIIGDQLFPGAMSPEAIRELIARKREGS